jgi:hypothetical protein
VSKKKKSVAQQAEDLLLNEVKGGFEIIRWKNPKDGFLYRSDLGSPNIADKLMQMAKAATADAVCVDCFPAYKRKHKKRLGDEDEESLPMVIDTGVHCDECGREIIPVDWHEIYNNDGSRKMNNPRGE